MIKLPCILILLFSLHVSAQNDSTVYHGFDTVRYSQLPERLQNEGNGYRNAIKFDALRFIDYLHTTTLLSYERYIGQYWGVEVSGGLMHKYMFVNNRPDALTRNRGFMADLHLKYYIDGNDPWWQSMFI